jgi:hypothetical protein
VSRLTARPITVHPSGSTPTAVANASSAWAWSNWQEVIASAAADLHVAGLSVQVTFVAQIQFEIEVGIGGVGVETGLHRLRSRIASLTAETNHGVLWSPVPLGGITAGDRVSIRVRSSSATTSVTYLVSLMAYETLTDTDHVAGSSTPMRSVPDAANATTITPNATPWAYSNWFEMTSGLGNEITILGIAPSGPLGTVEYEYELGRGSAGNEIGFTSIRTNNLQSETGGLRTFYLPAGHPIAASTRISIRMRKNGTSTTSHNAALIYLDNTATGAGSISASVFETITVADVVSAVLTNDIYVTAFETVTVAENVSQFVNVLVVNVAESIGVDDDATIPLGGMPYDRIFVRDYVALAPNALVIVAHESITVTDGPLYPTSDGVPGNLGPQPTPPTGSTGVVDYWLTGI